MLGVLSDSHGDISSLEHAMGKIGQVDVWVFLGDGVGDLAAAEALAGGAPLYAVRGNCDGSFSNVPRERLLIWKNQRMLMCHGHEHYVKTGLLRLGLRGLELEADAVFYGHTHIADVSIYARTVLVCPGAVLHASKGARVEVDERGIRPVLL